MKVWIVWLWFILCSLSTAMNDVTSITLFMANDKEAALGKTLYITLWFNFTIYEYSINNPQKGITYSSISSGTFSILGASDCHKPQYNNIPDTKMMFENNDADYVIIEKVSFNTASGFWYGIDAICLAQNVINFVKSTPAKTALITETSCSSGQALKWMCVNNKGPAESCSLGQYKMIVYFDINQPNQFITNAQFITDNSIFPEPKTCDPTHLPTAFPSIDPSTNTPTNEPSTEPTKEPSNESTKEPSIEPTKEQSIEPTNEPTNIPSLSPISHHINLPSLSPNKSPTLYPTNMPSLCPTSHPANIPSLSPIKHPSDPHLNAILSPPSTKSTAAPSYSFTVFVSTEDGSNYVEKEPKQFNDVVLIVAIVLMCIAIAYCCAYCLYRLLKMRKQASENNKHMVSELSIIHKNDNIYTMNENNADKGEHDDDFDICIDYVEDDNNLLQTVNQTIGMMHIEKYEDEGDGHNDDDDIINAIIDTMNADKGEADDDDDDDLLQVVNQSIGMMHIEKYEDEEQNDDDGNHVIMEGVQKRTCDKDDDIYTYASTKGQKCDKDEVELIINEDDDIYTYASTKGQKCDKDEVELIINEDDDIYTSTKGQK